MNYIVGISELMVSNLREDVIVTYSLGSCVGVTIYDPVACVGGMIHCMLPLSKIDPEKAQKAPAMFVDTGIPLLFEKAYQLGAQKDRIILKVAGASRILDETGTFKMGDRNYAVLRKILWKNGILINAEDVGGSIPRTLYLRMDTGIVTIKSRGNQKEL